MNWLFKEEPTDYGFDALVRDKKTPWSGVRNPLAQKHLRAVKVTTPRGLPNDLIANGRSSVHP